MTVNIANGTENRERQPHIKNTYLAEEEKKTAYDDEKLNEN